MTKRPSKRLWLQYTDLGLIFDNPFVYEDPCLPELFWHELEDEHVTATVINLPKDDLPALEHFSGLTPMHQKLCAQVAAWLLSTRRGFSAVNKGLGYPGGISDVASADGTLFAECGYTHVGKILLGLNEGFEMVVASYSFEPVLFRRVSAMHFEAYLKKQEEGARKTVELLPIALHYDALSKETKASRKPTRSTRKRVDDRPLVQQQLKQLSPDEELAAARALTPDDRDIAPVGGARRCSSCGRPGGGHEIDCLRVRRLAREKLQAACDHRSETVTQTLGDPPGPLCCGRCGLELPAPKEPS